MELTETFFFRKVSVPQSDHLVDVKLSCQVASNPSVSKVHENDVLSLQILQGLWVTLADYSFHLVKHLVDTRLHVCVVILDVIYQLA